MREYTDKVREHFLNPRNVGEVENPDGVAEVGSIACGDALKFSFKLDENKRLIGGHENIACEATRIVRPYTNEDISGIPAGTVYR